MDKYRTGAKLQLSQVAMRLTWVGIMSSSTSRLTMEAMPRAPYSSTQAMMMRTGADHRLCRLWSTCCKAQSGPVLFICACSESRTTRKGNGTATCVCKVHVGTMRNSISFLLLLRGFKLQLPLNRSKVCSESRPSDTNIVSSSMDLKALTTAEDVKTSTCLVM
jgi:hypothetical protein